MINQQLVDYIKQQMQAGVAGDAVRKALTDAGWPPADVDDSMRAATPAAAQVSQPVSQPTINPVVAMGGVEAPAGSSVAARSASTPVGSSVASDKFFAKPAAASQMLSDEDDDHPSVKKFIVIMAVMGVVILLLAGALAFVYFNLNGQLEAAQGGAVPSGDTASLQQQVSQLTGEKTDLATQVQTLTAGNQEALSELSFFTAATSGTSTAPVSATVKGMLSGNASTTFALTTAHNVKILVANSKDAKVAAVLTPLLAGTDPVTLSGTHLPASLNLTVTAVNGTAL